MAISLTIKLASYRPGLTLQNSCHLWLLDVDQLSTETIAQQRDILSAGELMQAQSLQRRQLHFIAIRAFVRRCLALYSGIHPRDLQLDTAAKGKPFLANSALALKFNLSHCNNLVVLAIGLQDELGVDIESIARNRRHRNIAARYFHPEELAQLAALDDSQYTQYFYRLWTLKEAFFKATGSGISAGLDKAAFVLDGEIITAMLADELQTSSANWQFHQTFISSDFCVALARESQHAHAIHWFDGHPLFIE